MAKKKSWGATPLIFILIVAGIALVAALRESNDDLTDSAESAISLRVFPMPETKLSSLSKPLKLDETDAILVNGFDTNNYKGKVWALHFWASWCAACKFEGEGLIALNKLLDNNVAGVAFNDTERDVVNFLKKYGFHYDSLSIDARGTASVDWGVIAVPETIIIDEDGMVFWRYRGAITKQIVNQEISAVLKNRK